MILKNLIYCFNSRKDNLVNPYIDKYRSYELEYKKINKNVIEIKFSLNNFFTGITLDCHFHD